MAVVVVRPLAVVEGAGVVDVAGHISRLLPHL